jgi:hypothetical protein
MSSITGTFLLIPFRSGLLLSLSRYKCPEIRTTLVVPGHILTPMFQTIKFPSSIAHRFFYPSIPPITVVKRIIAALDEQHSQVIMIPFYVHLTPFLTHLPSFLRDLAQWVRSTVMHLDRY